MLSALPLFLLLAGFVIGLGAVTVIDVLGFLSQSSSYWTQATIRAHKVTKPLIWIGLFLAIIGGLFFYHPYGWNETTELQSVLLIPLILNGLYLSFVVSPFLLAQEKKGKAGEVLPASLQWRIRVSFMFSVVGWWGSLWLLVQTLSQ